MTQQQTKSTAQVFFGDADVALKPMLQAREGELANTLGLRADQRATEYRDLTRDLEKSGLDPYTFGKRVLDLDIDGRIRQARGRTTDDAAFAQQVRRDGEATRQELATTYGLAEVDQLLARAQKFVKQFPALADMLSTDGIGERRDIVVPIVEHVRRINFR